MRFKNRFCVFFVVLVVLSLFEFGYAEENDEQGIIAEENDEQGIIEDVLEVPGKIIEKAVELPVKLVEGVFGFELAPLVITPLRSQEYAFNISKNTSVVTKEEIANSSATDLPGLIKEETGVVVSQLLTNPKGANVDIRGFGESSPSNVLVLIDGRRTNQIDLSGTDWAQIDLNTIERIEIVRGASSVLYGDNATGGVINIITKRGVSTEPTVRVGAEMGSHAYHKEYVEFEGYHDLLDYFFTYSHRDEGGYRENNEFKANNWFGRIVFHPADSFEFAASTGYHKDEYGQPGALYQPDLGNLGRKGTRFPNDYASTEDIYITGVPKLTLNAGDNIVTASVHNTYRRRESNSLNISSPAWHSQRTHEIDSGDIRPKIEVASDLFDGNFKNTLILGNDNFIAMDETLSGNILSARNTTQVTKRSNALYAYDNVLLFDKFLVNTGYRYEWVDYKFEQKGQATANDGKQLNEWAYEIGGGYKYNPRSQIYINHSRSYRFPTTEEYYSPVILFFGTQYGGLNRQIRQQVGHNLEVGIKDNSLKWLIVNADWFYIDTKRELFYDINDPNFIGNVNYSPRTRRMGFDVEAKANLWDGRLVPYVNYTRQRARFHGGAYDNSDFPIVPINKFTAGFTASPIENLFWNVSLNYVGSKFRINDPGNNVQKLNSYTTVDTKLSYKWKNLTVYGSVKNVFNRKYWVYGSTNSAVTAITYYPGPGTTFEAGGTIEF